MSAPRLSWPPIVAEAAAIALSYATRPTLRQLFYRLVAVGTLENTEGRYKKLSERTAKARREGWFPDLTDGTRRVVRPVAFDGSKDAVEALANQYHLDWTRGQERQVWVIVEKSTLETIATMATKDFGVPVAALRGFGSQTSIDIVSRQIADDGRPCEIIYLGDLDPSGEDIDRDLLARLTVRVNFTRLAVTPAQVTAMGLPVNPGKRTDSRAKAFIKKHGRLIQVEVEAIDPGTLETMIHDAVERLTDLSTLAEVKAEEANDVVELEQIAEEL